MGRCEYNVCKTAGECAHRAALISKLYEQEMMHGSYEKNKSALTAGGARDNGTMSLYYGCCGLAILYVYM